FLRDNISSMAVFADGKQLATLTDEQGESVVRISNPDGSKEQAFFKYPFKDWLLLASRLELYLQTKADSSFAGSLFQLSKNDYKKIMISIPGLTAAVNPAGQYIVSATATGSSFTSSLFNTKTGETKPLTVPVLPEKCVWTADQTFICATPKNIPTAGYPESWYRGRVHFSDNLVVINPSSGQTQLKAVSGVFDITAPQYSSVTKTLYFIDKQSGILFKTAL
ncbi:MAG TPA: hypothetical protein VLB02_02220, partial [Candidatus Paceibacterota bacterium]|nr:hypothetical protein [Candidatus Paceibacterota bacterium]